MTLTTDKPKVKETGAQLVGIGGVGAVLAAVLDFGEVLTSVDFSEHGLLGVALIGIGAAYRAFCKFCDTRGVPVNNDAVERLADSAEDLYEALHPVNGVHEYVAPPTVDPPAVVHTRRVGPSPAYQAAPTPAETAQVAPEPAPVAPTPATPETDDLGEDNRGD